ncbi:hypothetical protein [Arachidicoccus soli]|uniref:Uncharacterized protein n=1 Tax=Arachidicoccus soli TaxID=2341117 RepID=A0A386HQU2_9BACT|nr:hypothetical protein [Arachidicoccus soli]AYD48215.1 hypothetical protein D6B99_11765 [Arachidicoccus soli]
MQVVQRGISVFEALLFEEMEALPKRERNGRNPELLEDRDRLLLHRFYYKTKMQRKQYQDVLRELKNEFFLSTMQLQKILQCKGDEILHIKKTQPTVKWLRDEWGWMIWN